MSNNDKAVREVNAHIARELNALMGYYLENGVEGLEQAMREMAIHEMNKRRERIARNNAKLAALMSQVTDRQANSIYKNEANGYKFNQVIFSKRNPRGNVAVMLVKEQVYNEMTGRMGKKTMVVYSDGHVDSTFDKSIQISKDL